MTQFQEVNVIRLWAERDNKEFQSGTYTTVEEAVKEAQNLLDIIDLMGDYYVKISISSKEFQKDGYLIAHNVIWQNGKFREL